MKFHLSSSRGETKNNFSPRISRDRDSCQGLKSHAWGPGGRLCDIKHINYQREIFTMELLTDRLRLESIYK